MKLAGGSIIMSYTLKKILPKPSMERYFACVSCVTADLLIYRDME